MTDTPDVTPAEAIAEAMRVAYAAENEYARHRKPDGGGHQMPWRDVFQRMLTAAAPVIAARATAAEREACIRLARDHNAVVLRHDDPTNPVHACELPFADLLGGASHSAQTAPDPGQ